MIGGEQLGNVMPSTMQAWLRGVEGLAPRTRVLILGHVSAIFNAAVDDLLVARNPCGAKSVRRPKVPMCKVVPWAQEAVLAVREALPERYRVVAMLGAGLGLRQGEAFGLSPDDVDWLRGTVQVRRQVKLIGGHLVFAPPMYGREREVPLPESVKDWLAAFLTQFPARAVTLPWREPKRGKALNRSYYFNPAIWNPALRKAKVPVIRANGTHALRHFYAGALLDGGENVRALSECGARRSGFHAARVHAPDAVERRADPAGDRHRVRRSGPRRPYHRYPAGR